MKEYCEFCGEKLIKNISFLCGYYYDSDTGKKVKYHIAICPQKRWYNWHAKDDSRDNYRYC